MQIRPLSLADRDKVIDLYRDVFTDAQGVEAGEALEKLMLQLVDLSSTADVVGFGAFDSDSLIGAIYFSRLGFDDPRQVFMLSPVAVSTARQKTGVGKGLIREGLQQLARGGTDLVVTYGDPGYYGRFGFELLSQELVQAPHPLTMPQGWLGLPLGSEPLTRFSGAPSCVTAFNDQSLW